MLNKFINHKETFEINDFFQQPFEKKNMPGDTQLNDKPLKFFQTAASDLTNIRYFKNNRRRFIVRKGIENICILLENIVFFYCENKVTYAIDKEGTKFLVEINLGEVEKELDSSVFFRANRQFIINVNFIRGFRAYEKVKLKVNLVSEQLNAKYCIIISQEKSSIFRKWICVA